MIVKAKLKREAQGMRNGGGGGDKGRGQDKGARNMNSTNLISRLQKDTMR